MTVMQESEIHNHFEEESLKECEGVGRAQSDAECNEIKEEESEPTTVRVLSEPTDLTDSEGLILDKNYLILSNIYQIHDN